MTDSKPNTAKQSNDTPDNLLKIKADTAAANPLQPSTHIITQHPLFQLMLTYCGDRLTAHDLWHMNKRSVSGAVFWGVLCSFVLLPVQFVPAIIGAVWFRVNLPLTLAMTWLSNPLTVLPILYIAYWLGTWFTSANMISWADVTLLFDYVYALLQRQPLPQMSQTLLDFKISTLLVGLLVEALLVSSLAFVGVRLLWGNVYLVRWLAVCRTWWVAFQHRRRNKTDDNHEHR